MVKTQLFVILKFTRVANLGVVALSYSCSLALSLFLTRKEIGLSHRPIIVWVSCPSAIHGSRESLGFVSLYNEHLAALGLINLVVETC